MCYWLATATAFVLRAIVPHKVNTLDPQGLPKIAVVTCGFPCQDISNAGHQVGFEGLGANICKVSWQRVGCLRCCCAGCHVRGYKRRRSQLPFLQGSPHHEDDWRACPSFALAFVSQAPGHDTFAAARQP